MTSSQNWAGHSAHPKWSAATAIQKQCKHLLTAIFRLALAVTAIAVIPRADAEPLTWSLQDVTFASGQSVVGSFTIQGGALTDWNIQLFGGTDPTLTNLNFQPGGDCVVFCGELFNVGVYEPAPSGLDVRTPLASDDTFFELVVVYFNAPFSDLFDPPTTQIAINSASEIDYEKLINPTTVELLKRDSLSTTDTNARVALIPEPSSLFLFAVGSAPLTILVRYRLTPSRRGNVNCPKEGATHSSHPKSAEDQPLYSVAGRLHHIHTLPHRRHHNDAPRHGSVESRKSRSPVVVSHPNAAQ